MTKQEVEQWLEATPLIPVSHARLREFAAAAKSAGPYHWEVFVGSGNDFTIITGDEFRELVRRAYEYSCEWSER